MTLIGKASSGGCLRADRNLAHRQNAQSVPFGQRRATIMQLPANGLHATRNQTWNCAGMNRHAFWLKVTSAPTIELPEYAAFAEELGFEGLMIGEHLLQPPASHAASNVAQKTPSIYPYGDGVPTWNPQMNRP